MTRKDFDARGVNRMDDKQRKILEDFLTQFAQEVFENHRVSVYYAKSGWRVACLNDRGEKEYLGACGLLESDISYIRRRIRAIAKRY